MTGAFLCRPVDVAPGGDLQAEIAYYGSHPSSDPHTEALCAKFVQDVVNGRAVAFTDFSVAPPCELGHVFADVCRRILYLRQRHGVVARVMLCRIDVKDTFARFT